MGPRIGAKKLQRGSFTVGMVESRIWMYKAESYGERSLDQSGRAPATPVDTRDPKEDRRILWRFSSLGQRNNTEKEGDVGQNLGKTGRENKAKCCQHFKRFKIV